MVYNDSMNNYYQDETEQWWYKDPKRGNRYRVPERTCEQCGKTFINRHSQRYCSKACLGISQRGIRRPPRKCEWCGNEFIPVRTTQKCCSLRCAYDLGNTKRGLKGELNPRWKGEIRPQAGGYIRQYVPRRGYLLQHRLIMEDIIGRPLLRHEEVHHRNGIRDDNRIENLELWIKRQPGGQRVKDLIEYAHWVLDTYGYLERFTQVECLL